MTTIGNQICSFPNCTRKTHAFIVKTHHYSAGNLKSENAVCEPHYASVIEPDDGKAAAILAAISSGKDWRSLSSFNTLPNPNA